MRLAWQAAVAIGVVVLAFGAYAIWTSQNQIDYVNSCKRAVACGTVGYPSSQLFLGGALSATLQQAQLGWLAGALMVGLGLVVAIYGVYLHPERRAQIPAARSPPASA